MTIPTTAPRLTQLTPILIVEQIEPCLAFWVERLGFVRTTDAPGDDGRLMFAAIEKNGIEIMYQTRASVIAERADAAVELVGHNTVLFIGVENIDAIEQAMAGATIVKPRHRTFYGSTEIYVCEPGGSTIGFAQMA